MIIVNFLDSNELIQTTSAFPTMDSSTTMPLGILHMKYRILLTAFFHFSLGPHYAIRFIDTSFHIDIPYFYFSLIPLNSTLSFILFVMFFFDFVSSCFFSFRFFRLFYSILHISSIGFRFFLSCIFCFRVLGILCLILPPLLIGLLACSFCPLLCLNYLFLPLLRLL